MLLLLLASWRAGTTGAPRYYATAPYCVYLPIHRHRRTGAQGSSVPLASLSPLSETPRLSICCTRSLTRPAGHRPATDRQPSQPPKRITPSDLLVARPTVRAKPGPWSELAAHQGFACRSRARARGKSLFDSSHGSGVFVFSRSRQVVAIPEPPLSPSPLRSAPHPMSRPVVCPVPTI